MRNNTFILQIKRLKTSLVFILLSLLNCGNFDENPTSEKEGNTTTISNFNRERITVQKISDTSFKKQIISNGVIEAIQKSDLRFKISDEIISIKVKNGQEIFRGQVLAVLDNSILLNQIEKAKIDLDKAKLKFIEEKINFGFGDSINLIIDSNIIKNLKMKSGEFEARNKLENSKLRYSQTILKAPFNGLVANIKTKEGNYITSNEVFCTVVSQQKVEVVFSILEKELAFIEKNQRVEISPFSNLGENYKGFISEINPIVDKNGLIQVKARLDNSKVTLFDGMHVKVIINKNINNVVVIPKEALVLRSNKEVVFTLVNGLAKWNYVEVVDENSSSYAIKEGLKLNDTIIISGNMNLSHGAKVNPTFVEE